jgi:hypothetical protein
VSAPGLYGNQNAREYFYNVFAQFVCQEDSNYVDCIDNNDFINKSNVRFKTSFVISATSLDRNTERYFLFHHDGSGIDGRQTLKSCVRTTCRVTSVLKLCFLLRMKTYPDLQPARFSDTSWKTVFDSCADPLGLASELSHVILIQSSFVPEYVGNGYG